MHRACLSPWWLLNRCWHRSPKYATRPARWAGRRTLVESPGVPGGGLPFWSVPVLRYRSQSYRWLPGRGFGPSAVRTCPPRPSGGETPPHCAPAPVDETISNRTELGMDAKLTYVALSWVGITLGYRRSPIQPPACSSWACRSLTGAACTRGPGWGILRVKTPRLHLRHTYLPGQEASCRL